MIFAVERFADFLDELNGLKALHYEKAAVFKDKMPLNLDEDTYLYLDNQDKLHCVTARIDGRLVGYSVYIVTQALHYKDKKLAENTLWFMAEEAVKEFNGFGLIRLIDWSTNSLKTKGVFKVVHRAKKHTRGNLIFEYLKHTPIETVYAVTLE